jgi:anti-sigma regulatory factor (Ser/Thr protein kinase)
MASSTATARNAVQHPPHPLRLSQEPPTRAALDLGALPTAPGCARAWTRQVLWEWQLTALWDTAELVVSELTTNAMLVSGRLGHPHVRLTLIRDDRELVISVYDHSPSGPEPANAGVEDENGRGLLLVEALSSQWGWYTFNEGTHGKVVWAVVSS